MAYAEDDGVCFEQEVGDAVNKLCRNAVRECHTVMVGEIRTLV